MLSSMLPVGEFGCKTQLQREGVWLYVAKEVDVAAVFAAEIPFSLTLSPLSQSTVTLLAFCRTTWLIQCSMPINCFSIKLSKLPPLLQFVV